MIRDLIKVPAGDGTAGASLRVDGRTGIGSLNFGAMILPMNGLWSPADARLRLPSVITNRAMEAHRGRNQSGDMVVVRNDPVTTPFALRCVCPLQPVFRVENQGGLPLRPCRTETEGDQTVLADETESNQSTHPS